MSSSPLFWILALALVGSTLVLLLLPLLRQRRTETAPADEDATTAVFRDHKRQLDAERASGAITDAEHAAALAELTQRFGAELEPAPVPARRGGSRGGIVAALVLVALLPVAAGILYVGLGNPAAVVPQAAPAAAVDDAEIETMVAELAARLKAHPEDGEGWMMLGRAYRITGHPKEATAAYAEAVKRLPPSASLLVDWAEAMAQAQGRSLIGEPTQILERALALEPTSAKALALAGAAAMERGDRAQAITLWTKLRSVLPAGSPQFAQIEAALARAGVTLPDAAPSAPGAAPGVSGRVELDPKLAGNVAPTDTVFIFARDPDGPRAPLAALKIPARDLPYRFELTDAMAMTPNATLSRAGKIVVEARVSRSGDAKAVAGDLAGSSATLAPGARDVVVRIDRVLP